jgi:hypothetical protein
MTLSGPRCHNQFQPPPTPARRVAALIQSTRTRSSPLRASCSGRETACIQGTEPSVDRDVDEIRVVVIDGDRQTRLERPDGVSGAPERGQLGAFDIHFDEIDPRQRTLAHQMIDGGRFDVDRSLRR